MEKRFILAIVLSFLMLFLWTTFVYKPQHPPEPPVGAPTQSSTVVSTENAAQKSTQAPPVLYAEGSSFDFNLDDRAFVFLENLGAIKSVKFLSYQGDVFLLKQGFLLADPSLTFRKTAVSSDTVTFVYEDKTKRITKRFVFSKTNYDLYLELEIENLSATPLPLTLPLILGNLDLNETKDQQSRFFEVTAAKEDKITHTNIRKSNTFENVKFLGFKNQYFCGIIAPEKFTAEGFVQKESNTNSLFGLKLQEEIQSGQKISRKYHIYLGPQDLKILTALNPEWTNIMNFGTFDFISQILLKLLEFIFKVVHNWGVAIILLSVLMYLLLYPLSIKQMRSMKELQAIQPKIEALRVLYKDNPQRLNKETIELYREHKVNPFGGCLPLLLQIPIFFALYQALMRSIALKGAKFLWITDLSQPDRLFSLPVSLPVVGNEFNILPILMLIGMFFQQKISMKSTGGTSNEQQKIMLIVMPIMFGLIFYRMPSGLVLYWFINNIFMLINQIKISLAK